MKKPWTVICGDHRKQPMEIICEHLDHEGMEKTLGFHIIGKYEGVRLAVCTQCKEEGELRDKEKTFGVCRQCFNRIQEIQELRALEL